VSRRSLHGEKILNAIAGRAPELRPRDCPRGHTPEHFGPHKSKLRIVAMPMLNRSPRIPDIALKDHPLPVHAPSPGNGTRPVHQLASDKFHADFKSATDVTEAI